MSKRASYGLYELLWRTRSCRMWKGKVNNAYPPQTPFSPQHSLLCLELLLQVLMPQAPGIPFQHFSQLAHIISGSLQQRCIPVCRLQAPLSTPLRPWPPDCIISSNGDLNTPDTSPSCNQAAQDGRIFHSHSSASAKMRHSCIRTIVYKTYVLLAVGQIVLLDK
jgi:hypothetical protein